MYTRRFYREWVREDGLLTFDVKVDESDLKILCDRDLKNEALRALRKIRRDLEAYIDRDPSFLTAFEPYSVAADAPPFAAAMARAAVAWSVGPMAAVAGAVSQAVGESLLEQCSAVIIENGGDVYVKSEKPVKFALYAGEDSPFSNRVFFEVNAREGLGVCTSSGVVGPSVSFGRADAVTAMAPDAAVADAAATAIANRVQSAQDIERVVQEEKDRGLLQGLIACAGDRIGFFGDIKLVA